MPFYLFSRRETKLTKSFSGCNRCIFCRKNQNGLNIILSRNDVKRNTNETESLIVAGVIINIRASTGPF